MPRERKRVEYKTTHQQTNVVCVCESERKKGDESMAGAIDSDFLGKSTTLVDLRTLGLWHEVIVSLLESRVRC